jgi:hypothetical protein
VGTDRSQQADLADVVVDGEHEQVDHAQHADGQGQREHGAQDAEVALVLGDDRFHELGTTLTSVAGARAAMRSSSGCTWSIETPSTNRTKSSRDASVRWPSAVAGGTIQSVVIPPSNDAPMTDVVRRGERRHQGRGGKGLVTGTEVLLWCGGPATSTSATSPPPSARSARDQACRPGPAARGDPRGARGREAGEAFQVNWLEWAIQAR